MRHTSLALAILAGSVSFSGPALADMYSFVDENGVTHVTNVPSDKRYKLWFRSETGGRATVKKGPRSARYDTLIADIAAAHDLDRALLHAIVSVESGYNARAVSRKGAIGLMQLMPETASRYGVKDLFDPAQNLKAGAAYLRDLLRLFKSDVRLAIAAYNAGEGAILKYGNQVPPYPETVAYLPKVLDLYERYRTQL